MGPVSVGGQMLEACELSVTYGPFTAVDRVSLQAAAGEIVGLLGPNGAGKTSVIRALTTIVPLAGGSATINGHAVEDAIGLRASIGVLPESNGYPPAQTARSYLRFHGQLFGLPRAEAEGRAARLLVQVGLGDNTNRIATFSRGMRQRLGLTRAMINDPAVLFLDEPTLGLDPAGKEEIIQHLTRAAVEHGTCVVLCSHLLDEVERVCDRVAIMHRARIVAEGTVADVVAASGIAGHGTIRVDPTEVLAAEGVLKTSAVAGSIRFDNTRPGDLDFRLPDTEGARSDILRRLAGQPLDAARCQRAAADGGCAGVLHPHVQSNL